MNLLAETNVVEANRVGRPIERLLSSYSPLRPGDIESIGSGLADVRSHPVGRPISLGSTETANSNRVVLSGWIAWSTHLSDGRRQIVSLALAGDLLEPAPRSDLALAHVPIMAAMTADARELVSAVERFPSGSLALAWRLARRDAEARRIRHILRLGQLSAYERTACLMLDLYERQRRVGLARDGSMVLPLTQETLGEVLGLSTVHMNRVLQQLRRDGLIAFSDGRVNLPSPDDLAQAAMRD